MAEPAAGQEPDDLDLPATPPRRRGRWLTLVAVLATLAVALGSVYALSAARSNSQPDGFTFGVTGDHDNNERSEAVLAAMGSGQLDFGLSLGDLAYDRDPEAVDSWCTMAKDSLNRGAGRPPGDSYGERFPLQVVEGNHEGHSLEGYLGSDCLPDRLDSTPSPMGGYGREYFFDYPAESPLARFIMTPSLSRKSYQAGSPRYQWLSETIDSARAEGIKWVVVGRHENYISMGKKEDEVGSDFFNLLVRKKVDLLVQAHDHTYQRSKQLRLGPQCSAVEVNQYNEGCVAGDGARGSYVAGAGTVVLVTGTGGRTNYRIDPKDPEAGYFVNSMGVNTADAYGYTKISVTSSAITGNFVRAAGGRFGDQFTIGSPDELAAPTSSVSGLVADSSVPSRVALNWEDPAQQAARTLSYEVSRDGSVIGMTSARSFVDSVPSSDPNASYEVRAVDAAGTRGPPQVVNAARRLSGTTTIVASADATLDATDADRQLGRTSSLRVDSTPHREALVKFVVSGAGSTPVRRAVLRLYTTNPSRDPALVRPTAAGWDDSVTASSAPAAWAVLATFAPLRQGTWVEADVTAFIKSDGVYALRLAGTGRDGAEFASREAGTTAPQLVVTPSDPDRTPPARVTGLRAVATSSATVVLAWNPASDDRGVRTYRVLLDGVHVAATPGTRLVDRGLEAGAELAYTVQAVDGAGNVGPPSAARAVKTRGASRWLALAPIADATVRKSSVARNYGDEATLSVDADPVDRALLKFSVQLAPGERLSVAFLRLHAADRADDGGTIFSTRPLGWAEHSISWLTAPQVTGPALGRTGPLQPDTWSEVDVRRAVSGPGTVTFSILGTGTDGADYTSREDSRGDAPRLVIAAYTS